MSFPASASAPPPPRAVEADAGLDWAGCPLCGQGETRPRQFRFAPHAVVRCAGCGLWYLRPRLPEPSMLERYRTASYFAGPGAGYSNYEAQEATLRRTFRSFLRELDRRGSLHGRLLEVGCAYGYFLEEARRYFSVRVGTDFSPEALAKAAPAADRVVLGGLADLRPGELFEFAAVIHVIEHIYEPVRFLEELRLRLVPGGRVLVATPDFGSLWRHLLGRRWPFFKVPEHVAFFDRATLPALLRRAGFEAPVPLAYPSLFPLGLVAEKVGLRLGGALHGWPVWIPATSIAFSARNPDARPL